MTAPTDSLLTTEFVFPAAFAQQRLWLLCQLAPDNPFYNMSAAIRLTGKLDRCALERAFNEIVRRHEILRTRFEFSDGQLNQVIADHVTLPLPLTDYDAQLGCNQAAHDQLTNDQLTSNQLTNDQLTSDQLTSDQLTSNQAASAKEAIATQRAIAEAQRPFNLTTDVLIRVMLLRLAATDHILLITLHHIIADGWSIGVFVRELGALYAAYHTGHGSPLPELPIQYADFADWQRSWLEGNAAGTVSPQLESHLAYWRQQLADLPLLNLPTDRPRPAVQSYRGAMYPIALSSQLSDAIVALSQAEGVTLFMTVLTAFQILLARYTGQDEIVVGSPIANRTQPELENLIGCFVNSLVLRTDLSGNPSVRQLLANVREVTLDAYAHQDLPFEKLVQALQPERDLSRHPLFQVAIALQNTPITALALPDLTLSQFEFDPGTSRFDLELHLWQSSTGLNGQLIYSSDLFDRSTIARFVDHFQTLLAGMVAAPTSRIADLPILTSAEAQQLLVEWNQTQHGHLDGCIHEWFAAQAAAHPSVIAAVQGTESLTYQELNQRSNQLAHYLCNLGIAPHELVGLCVDRSLDLLIGILGILKAGAAYLPLDPHYPPERLKFMLEDAQVSTLLTHTAIATRFDGIAPTLVLFDRDRARIAQASSDNLLNRVTLTDLAYVIYTSGSTGQPKGVLIEHRGLANVAAAQIQILDLQSSQSARILQFASPSFDASIFEIVMAWGAGATLYFAPENARLGTALREYLYHQQITHATLPPAVLKTLPNADLPALQSLITAGEACSPDLVDRWATGRRFFNAYGLTETTIWSTIAELKPGDLPTIGRAIANTQLYVLDAHFQPVPIGIPGELYIGGVGVARGYLKRSELMTERFVPNPFSDGATLYRTGDLVRYQPSGQLEFLGRRDRQIKLRGYRIELEEIERTICQHPDIRDAIVITRNDQVLIADVVLTSGSPLTHCDLHHFLSQRLPHYMVPAEFVVRSTLPLTPSGKIDRPALASSAASPLPAGEFVAPRTPTETTLVAIWQQTLDRQQIGVQDNFFELGGSSLLAMRLIDRVNQQFRQTLPLADLFHAPTIEQLALRLAGPEPCPPLASNSVRERSWSPLVPLQPKGTKPPFFCVHPVFGVTLPYIELAGRLGSDQPFYGLQPFGLDGIHPPLTSIEAMATQYIAALRHVQPHGPYQLGGWSFGGLVAFEMAQQLRQAGDRVSLLALFDTQAPTSRYHPSVGKIAKFLITTVARSIGPFVLDYGKLVALSLNQQSVFSQLRAALEHTMMAQLLPQASQVRMLDELTLHRMLRIFYANSRAALRYVPQPYPDSMTLFKTGELVQESQDAALGWRELAQNGLQLHSVSGNHLTLLQPPHIQSLVAQLQPYLSDSQRSGHSPF